MSTEDSRVFSPEYLAQAGRLTVDLIAENLVDKAEALALVERFQLEILTMYYSYTNWEDAILDEMVALGGNDVRQQALEQIENADIAPERLVPTEGLAERWNTELEGIREAVDAGETSSAEARCRALYDQALTTHDGLMSRVAALLSVLYEEYGDEVLTRVLNKVMRPELMDPDGKLPFRDKVEKIMHFTRVHLLPFSVEEDDEKVTFHTDPCPSGARLIRGGHYQAPRNDSIVRNPGPLTWGRPELPVYCCHEPAMERSSILRHGVPIFIIEPSEDIGISPCKTYIYKNPRHIPEAYYRRLGLNKPDNLIAVSD